MRTHGKDKEILKELREITKAKENWRDRIDDVADKLNEEHSAAVKAKVLWLLGEMGLRYPMQAEAYIKDIAGYLEDDSPKLRERAVGALGRIGRADKYLVIPYLDKIMDMRKDTINEVKLAFIWACENIATSAPELFCEKLELFYELISDPGERVRIEAPEMFRVIGKRKPQYVKPYLEKLQWFAENDPHPVVRIHSAGAVRMTKKAFEEAGKYRR
ncbi:MAG: HEAT repeat domain-containing protein [Peptostreptococcaceae bacterium]|nr:HEAT repeat domain-containing protein [Peptostreptococcaceae bacterium]